MKRCSVDGCTGDTSKGGKGHCGMHWQRIRRTGTAGTGAYQRDPARSTAERIYPRLVERNGCWVWTGAARNGYGAVGVGQRVEYVHRWVYEDMVGPIPQGLVLDHLCVNRLCANPDHVDPVTDAVNKARGGLTRGERAA